MSSIATISPLESAWSKLGLPRSIYLELAALYSSPKRYYHNDQHLLHCLREYADIRRPWKRLVEIALWFHDAIYNPQQPDNELRSANLARERLSGTSLTMGDIDDVARLILATTHKTPPEKPDEQLIADIDLAILGQSPEIFDDYEKNIRREYAHMSEAEFRTGRARVLRRFLSWPFIYSTPHFRDRYESPARQNLNRSIAALGAAPA